MQPLTIVEAFDERKISWVVSSRLIGSVMNEPLSAGHRERE
jgi:hypothetical protein